MSSSSSELSVQTCDSDFYVLGLQGGEAEATFVRMVCTIIAMSLISSWCNKGKIKKQLLFFSHWMSGVMHQLADLIMSTLVLVCWSKSRANIAIKALKFMEQTSTNMLAVTNLGICVNLALIVSSQHTMSRVQSVSSPKLVLCYLSFSLVVAAAVVPFWETIIVTQTLYWPANNNEASLNWILTSIFWLEFVVGLSMLIIVTLLLIFRMPELKQCWMLHQRIRYYFGLTIIAIVVNLVVGVGGLIVVTLGWEKWGVLSWGLRHTHIALDTLVLYNYVPGSDKRVGARGGIRNGTKERIQPRNKICRVRPETGISCL